MGKTLVAPPAWPAPPCTTEQMRRRQLAEIRAQYPDALAWYGEKSKLWMAAPTGATAIICAPTAAVLAQRIHEHYKKLLRASRSASARPVRRRTSSGNQAGAVVRSMPFQPVASRTTVPPSSAGSGRHASRQHGRFRRAMVSFGLVGA